MTRFNREDARTVLPQLEKELREHENEIKAHENEIRSADERLTVAETKLDAFNIVSTTTISDFITFENDWSLDGTGFYAVRYGKIAMFRMYIKSSSDISVPASGNITDIQIGTIKPEWRSVMVSGWQTWGNNAGMARGYHASNGEMYMSSCEGTGTARTIAAGSVFNTLGIYLLLN